jgi:hypothetical protein
MKTLVVGCDASGKSTLVRGIHAHHGDVLVESGHSSEALAFKTAHMHDCIGADFIDEREAFYLQLEAREQPRTASITGNFVTTQSTLVTRLAHSVMRTCISEPGAPDDAIIVHWLNDEQQSGTRIPDNIILTRADPSVIRERMTARQQSGMPGEEFWGFNSPFFLERYQLRWENMLASLGEIGITCAALDTSHIQPAELLAHYRQVRPDINM